jgi:Holliday junction resolvase-like predicted endonuclease
VEVKTMRYGSVSIATEHFTLNKKRCVHRAVLMYLVKKGWLGCDWQFDLICISLKGERRLRHYENVAL